MLNRGVLLGQGRFIAFYCSRVENTKALPQYASVFTNRLKFKEPTFACSYPLEVNILDSTTTIFLED